MGLCNGKMTPEERAEAKRSREIDKRNKEAAEEEKGKIKLLLLGAGESGKSTIFRQMKILYGVGLTDEDKRVFTPLVYHNTMQCMRTVLEQMEPMGHELDAGHEGVRDRFLAFRLNDPVNGEVGELVAKLWADAGVRATYDMRARYQLFDCAAYMFDNIGRIAEEDYVATEEDILRVRVKTTGIVEDRFRMDRAEFCMFDVGGQRNERKKWIHCFEDVTAVIFVASLSEYDQVCFEDTNTNRMEDALDLFEEVCGYRWFRKTSTLLFLNKRDLFEQKIKRVDLRVLPGDELEEPRFEDYEEGVCTCGLGYPLEEECTCGVQLKAKEYLTQQFLQRNGHPDKEIYYHITCATDTGNMRVVFNACKDIILRSNLAIAGFVGFVDGGDVMDDEMDDEDY